MTRTLYGWVVHLLDRLAFWTLLVLLTLPFVPVLVFDWLRQHQPARRRGGAP